MLLKVGAAMMVLSITLAVGVAAVVGFRNENLETATLSSVESRAVETTVKEDKGFSLGKKLEIDDAAPVKKEPAPKPRPKPAPAKAPAPVPDWPRPTVGELDSASEPRYYGPNSEADMTLTVEAIGLYDVPVISSPDLSVLDSGLMHEPETSLPWEGGAQRNVFIAGHYLGWPGTASHLVFYNLDKLRSGDRAVLRDRQGRVHEYRVSEVFGASPEDSWVMGQVVGRDMLTLQTCIPPSFETRLVVRADRV